MITDIEALAERLYSTSVPPEHPYSTGDWAWASVPDDVRNAWVRAARFVDAQYELRRGAKPLPMAERIVSWVTELVVAATELGYGVVEITPKHIVLDAMSPKMRSGQVQVTVESYLLSGALLRQVLVDRSAT
jgi:hypothetical protein